jgi:hypothetical protein
VVEDVLIPIIVEVKTYHCSDVDNSHHTSLGSRNKGLVEARNQYDVKIEVKYLFSGRRQPSMIAIAGAGPCWTRRQFFQASRRMKAGCLSTMMWTSFCLARCWTCWEWANALHGMLLVLLWMLVSQAVVGCSNNFCVYITSTAFFPSHVNKSELLKSLK